MSDKVDAGGGGRVDRGSGGRGAPLVATWTRWSLSSAAGAVAFATMLAGCLAFVHSTATLASFKGTVALAAALGAVLILLLLRAEEAQVARELRTARTGTAALRAMVVGRRLELPFFARLFSTRVGTAAVLLADGDRTGALAALAASSGAMRGGRMDQLREIVESDIERARGTPEALERTMAGLWRRQPTGNREADLYALHVLVKAILERGEADMALEVAQELERSHDEEERLYLVWLRTWFDLDEESVDESSESTAAGPKTRLSDGEVRMAALLARAHGAAKLVEKLEHRVGGVARTSSEE